MVSTDDETSQLPRVGTYADLARRMDRMESKHEDLAKEVASLTVTTGQVVQNQNHAEDLNKLRFQSLDIAVNGISTDLKGFMSRMEGIISGEVQTAAGRVGQETVADFVRWRKDVTETLDEQEVRNGKEDLIARLVWGLVGANAIAIASAILWLASGNHL